jgi:hypothetical protein
MHISELTVHLFIIICNNLRYPFPEFLMFLIEKNGESNKHQHRRSQDNNWFDIPCCVKSLLRNGDWDSKFEPLVTSSCFFSHDSGVEVDLLYTELELCPSWFADVEPFFGELSCAVSFAGNTLTFSVV